MGWTGYGLHRHPGDAQRFLIIADETAFPAVRGILDSSAAPDTARVHRVLRDAGDESAIDAQDASTKALLAYYAANRT